MRRVAARRYTYAELFSLGLFALLPITAVARLLAGAVRGPRLRRRRLAQLEAARATVPPGGPLEGALIEEAIDWF